MMKTIVLGDIHGRTMWKDIVNKENPDRVIFIGDYFDSREEYTAEDEMNNFLDIIEYKKTSGKEVILLIGNHDFHYLELDKEYSGFQYGAHVSIHQLLKKHREHLQMAYFLHGAFGDILFTHSGVTATFMMQTGWGGESITGWLNDLFYYRPRTFQFISGGDQYGDDTYQSPIWVRPKSLVSDPLPLVIQVVGHTRQQEITHIKKGKNRFYFIDTLGISGEYLVIDNVIKTGRYEKVSTSKTHSL